MDDEEAEFAIRGGVKRVDDLGNLERAPRHVDVATERCSCSSVVWSLHKTSCQEGPSCGEGTEQDVRTVSRSEACGGHDGVKRGQAMGARESGLQGYADYAL